jgi:cytochrome c oxidase cbb3-type subunit 2
MFQIVDHAPPGVAPVVLPTAYAPARGVVVPTRDAQALIAYLLALKQAPFPGEENRSTATINGAAGAPTSASAPVASSDEKAQGRALFTATCAACHQATGEGLPGAFPALKGNSTVNDADPTRHIQVVLKGLQGANVGGIVYPSPMPAFGTTLSDAEVASIINYERTSWGNRGTPVTREQVAAERARGN